MQEVVGGLATVGPDDGVAADEASKFRHLHALEPLGPEATLQAVESLHQEVSGVATAGVDIAEAHMDEGGAVGGRVLDRLVRAAGPRRARLLAAMARPSGSSQWSTEYPMSIMPSQRVWL